MVELIIIYLTGFIVTFILTMGLGDVHRTIGDVLANLIATTLTGLVWPVWLLSEFTSL